MNFWPCFGFLLGSLMPVEAQMDLEKRGPKILKEIVDQEWARDWKGSTLDEVKLVAQKPDLDEPTGLPPVWSAIIKGPNQQSGHLMWDSRGEGRLVEFSLDAKMEITGDSSAAILGVPALQEFPMKGEDGRLIASGCVPTAAASVVSYWVSKGYPQWQGKDGKTLEGLALRIRSRLTMTLYPDTDGFSANGMDLAGAFPSELVKALRTDALEHKVAMDCEIARFSMEKLREEIGAKRPALLSCVVRVAHKPDLSWGHEVAAVGFSQIDGVELVGVLDNFFPTKNSETIRWIRKDAFSSIIVLRPKLEIPEK